MNLTCDPNALIAIKWACGAIAVVAITAAGARIASAIARIREDRLYHERTLKIMEHGIATGREVNFSRTETALKHK